MVKFIVLNKEEVQVGKLNIEESQMHNKTLRRKKSILDILLDNKIDIYYGCMGGSCSACVVTVVSGDEYMDNEGLHEQVYKGIEDDQILTCIATVKDEYMNSDCEIKLMLKY